MPENATEFDLVNTSLTALRKMGLIRKSVSSTQFEMLEATLAGEDEQNVRRLAESELRKSSPWYSSVKGGDVSRQLRTEKEEVSAGFPSVASCCSGRLNFLKSNRILYKFNNHTEGCESG